MPITLPFKLTFFPLPIRLSSPRYASFFSRCLSARCSVFCNAQRGVSGQRVFSFCFFFRKNPVRSRARKCGRSVHRILIGVCTEINDAQSRGNNYTGAGALKIARQFAGALDSTWRGAFKMRASRASGEYKRKTELAVDRTKERMQMSARQPLRAKAERERERKKKGSGMRQFLSPWSSRHQSRASNECRK